MVDKKYGVMQKQRGRVVWGLGREKTFRVFPVPSRSDEVKHWPA